MSLLDKTRLAIGGSRLDGDITRLTSRGVRNGLQGEDKKDIEGMERYSKLCSRSAALAPTLWGSCSREDCSCHAQDTRKSPVKYFSWVKTALSLS